MGGSYQNIFKIIACSKSDCSDNQGQFDVYLPPEKLSFAYTLKYKQDNPNTSGKKSSFEGYDQGKLNFTFVLDATGAAQVGNAPQKSITEQIDKLNNIVYKVNVDDHKPYYLRVEYGTSIKFKCEMHSCNIDYVLFDSKGDPLRAKVTMSMVEIFIPKESKERKFASPDMTHIRFFKESDNLFTHCVDIYKDMNHYIQIANINKELNFRNIAPGRSVIFPPFETI